MLVTYSLTIAQNGGRLYAGVGLSFDEAQRIITEYMTNAEAGFHFDIGVDALHGGQ